MGVLHVASDCRLAVDPAAPLRESGVLDYAEAEVYNAGVLVRVDATVSTLDHISIDVVVDGAEHSLVWKWEDWPNEDVTASVAGHRATHVWLTPSALALTTAAELASGPREARKRALSTVVVHGVTTNGEPVMSEPWQYPIDLCYDCLVTFPPEALVVQPDGSQLCVINVPTPLCSSIECPCFPGSDEPIDCRLCASDPNNTVCTTPP